MTVLPRKKLALLPELRWKGHLRVLSRLSTGYAVEFDAEERDLPPGATERFVFDRAVLTPTQLKDWTGWSEMAAEDKGTGR